MLTFLQSPLSYSHFLANFVRLYDQSQWLPWSCAGPLSKNEPSVQTHNSIFSCQEIVKKVKNKINKNKKRVEVKNLVEWQRKELVPLQRTPQ